MQKARLTVDYTKLKRGLVIWKIENNHTEAWREKDRKQRKKNRSMRYSKKV